MLRRDANAPSKQPYNSRQGVELLGLADISSLEKERVTVFCTGRRKCDYLEGFLEDYTCPSYDELAIIITRYCMASFLCHLFILRAKLQLISPVEVLPCGCAVLYDILDAQLSFILSS